MSSEEMDFLYHGLLLPRETHSVESLKFADEFTFKDDDVVAATYPKTGRCLSGRLKLVLVHRGVVVKTYCGHVTWQSVYLRCFGSVLLLRERCIVLVILHVMSYRVWLTASIALLWLPTVACSGCLRDRGQKNQIGTSRQKVMMHLWGNGSKMWSKWRRACTNTDYCN